MLPLSPALQGTSPWGGQAKVAEKRLPKGREFGVAESESMEVGEGVTLPGPMVPK